MQMQKVTRKGLVMDLQTDLVLLEQIYKMVTNSTLHVIRLVLTLAMVNTRPYTVMHGLKDILPHGTTIRAHKVITIILEMVTVRVLEAAHPTVPYAK